MGRFFIQVSSSRKSLSLIVHPRTISSLFPVPLVKIRLCDTREDDVAIVHSNGEVGLQKGCAPQSHRSGCVPWPGGRRSCPPCASPSPCADAFSAACPARCARPIPSGKGQATSISAYLAMMAAKPVSGIFSMTARVSRYRQLAKRKFPLEMFTSRI